MHEKERYRIGSYTNPSGVEVYRVSGRTPMGDQIRRNFRVRQEAIACKAELEIAALNINQAVSLKRTRLSDPQLADAEAAAQKLEGTGHALVTAVDYFLRNWKPTTIPKTVKDAYQEFLLDKKAQKLRERSI